MDGHSLFHHFASPHLRQPCFSNAISVNAAPSPSPQAHNAGMVLSPQAHNAGDAMPDIIMGNSDRAVDVIEDDLDVGHYSDSMAEVAKPVFRYLECMRNHAAAMGGHAVDGCGEFLPCGDDGLDALTCAACSCHRNFHHKVVEGGDVSCGGQGGDGRCSGGHNGDVGCIGLGGADGMMSGLLTPAMLAKPKFMAACQNHILMGDHASKHSTSCSTGEPSCRRRRHRTVFTIEQKEKMFYFAESLGWKISKHDEDSIQSFCDDVGVPRRIFRVWMHNHKHNMKSQ